MPDILGNFITILVAIVGAIAAFFGHGWYRERQGKKLRDAEIARRTIQAREDQAKDAANRPKTDRDLVDRLRGQEWAIVLVLMLASCAASTPTPACPMPVPYTPEQRVALAEAVSVGLQSGVLAPGGPIQQALADYLVLRAQSYSCQRAYR